MIVITIKPGGAVDVTPEGYTGNDCYVATKPYLKLLGGRQIVTQAPDDPNARAEAQAAAAAKNTRQQKANQ